MKEASCTHPHFKRCKPFGFTLSQTTAGVGSVSYGNIFENIYYKMSIWYTFPLLISSMCIGKEYLDIW